MISLIIQYLFISIFMIVNITFKSFLFVSWLGCCLGFGLFSLLNFLWSIWLLCGLCLFWSFYFFRSLNFFYRIHFLYWINFLDWLGLFGNFGLLGFGISSNNSWLLVSLLATQRCLPCSLGLVSGCFSLCDPLVVDLLVLLRSSESLFPSLDFLLLLYSLSSDSDIGDESLDLGCFLP